LRRGRNDVVEYFAPLFFHLPKQTSKSENRGAKALDFMLCGFTLGTGHSNLPKSTERGSFISRNERSKSGWLTIALRSLFVPSGTMAQVTESQLTNMALAVLEQVAARSRHVPQQQSRGVALALAYLAHVARPRDRSAFDGLWRAMRTECRITRAAYISANLNRIYTALGRRRETAMMSAFEREANELYGPPYSYSRETPAPPFCREPPQG